MAGLQILDANGKELSVGSPVSIDGLDTGRVTGFKHDWLGWRVSFNWASGYHPDEPEPTAHTELVEWESGKGGTYRTPHLTLISKED